MIRSAPVVAMGAAGFAAVLHAVKDVYSSEIFLRALPVMHLDQFTTRKECRQPPWDQVVEPEVLEIEQRIRTRVAAITNPGRNRRSYFDFGRFFGTRAS